MDDKIDKKDYADAASAGAKADAEFQAENIENSPGEVTEERVTLTEEDNVRIRHKTDRAILTILIWVYFLQILDKTVLGYSAIFGLREDTGLTGNQYSLLGSIAPIAQLAWQPFSSVLIVKVPHRILMPILVLGWGIAQSLTPLCMNFTTLLVNRFFLGLFEAGCLPLFSVITAQWYRRSEQPVRIAAWYGTNGLATIVGAALCYGLGHISSPIFKSWQIIFLVTGLITVATVPIIYLRLSNNPQTARFLTPTERLQCIERLRANQSGSTTNTTISWHQVAELFLDVKTYLWVVMALANNLGAQVTNTFGPLILSGLGFDKYKTTLLNMPFGAIQYTIILAVAYAAVKVRYKSLTLATILVPILIGLVLLYTLPRTAADGPGKNTGPLLVGYYFLAFIFGCNTMIVSWILANTAGTTKRSAMMSLYNAASSAGNIIGPLLFDAADAPEYHPGLRSTLGVYAMLVAVVVLQAGNLVLANRAQSRRRVAHGKPAVIVDHSMEREYVDMHDDGVDGLGQLALADLTDKENDEFIYVY
ncbi:major facilitator superfamily domain-containing protein [Podospora appendiculata]|uniref:Major facilitator superfamily domain-containing protein n=1 Tax=Podospora appendiculata TaxID=314037 RepID=A0AAE0XA49_9PEZI|nr:major facilitator superfamily domain-containing protein [Podospora appendiculata]